MNSVFYLQRNLVSVDKTFTEAELLSTSNFVVVLAEPGGGKTELMGSLAQQLGTKTVTASQFVYVEAKETNVPLVIDAFDELSKVNASAIYKLLGQAKKADPTHVYLSSRSSEWDIAATNAFNDFFGQQPLVVRLCEFSDAEQRAIFDHHVQGENFASF
jgi:cytidylate kinase